MIATSPMLFLMTVIIGANLVPFSNAWISSTTEISGVVVTADAMTNSAPKQETNQRMHVEDGPALTPTPTPAAIPKLPKIWSSLANLFSTPSTLPSFCHPGKADWNHSIQDSSIECAYKPIWDWQIKYYREHLTNFEEIQLPEELANVQSTEKAIRVRTKWYSSDEYRLVRMTYMDGGEMTQIFTTVCYPRANLPILGHGLLQLGDRRITISDFQPLEDSHLAYANACLNPMKDQFPSLNQEMSERFFQSGEFWSDSTLLGRFPKSSDEIWTDLWPAYKGCVETHLQLCQSPPSSLQCKMPDLLEKHAKYDAHVASRDPAIKMLTGIFGVEKASKIVYEALFPLAETPHQ